MLNDVSIHSVTSFHRRRPLFWLVLIFCFGIAFDQWMTPGLPAIGGFCLASIAACAAFLFLRQASVKCLWPWLFGGALALSGGMLLHALRARIPDANDISRRTPATSSFVFLRGTIIETSRARGSEQLIWTLDVTALGPDSDNLSVASGRVQVRINDETRVFGEGDCVELLARLESPPEITLPGSFDYTGFIENQGIRRAGIASAESVRRVFGTQWYRPDLALRRFSSVLVDRIERLLPSPLEKEGLGGSFRSYDEEVSSSQSGLLSALLFGRRDRVDSSDRESFAINGTAHLLAIAGWHLQFILFLFWRALGWTGLSRRKSAWLVIVSVCAFCALTGAAVPVVRATVMTVLYLCAPAFGREADPLSVLATAAFGILSFSPDELFTVGFQLSFLAVLALATIYPALEDAWASWRLSRNPLRLAAYGDSTSLPWLARLRERFAEYSRQTVLVSLAAWLGTAPAVAWHMDRFSTLSLAVNLIAVPVGGVCMVLGLAMLAVGAVSVAAGTVIGYLAFFGVATLQWINAAFASAPIASIDLPSPAIPVLVVYAAILGWAWIERGRAATLFRLALLLPACFLVLNAGLFFRDSAPVPRVTILDLRFGRAALVESPGGGAAMIDAGGPGQGPRIAETLRRYGIARLNLLVLTADEPDALGGALELVRRISVARVIFPRCAAASAVRRELERVLTQRGVPYGAPRSLDASSGPNVVPDPDGNLTLRGPGDVLWEFSDDGPPTSAPAAAETALCLRLSLPGTRMLFVTARSKSAIDRLLINAPNGALETDILRLTSTGAAHWPSELSQLIGRSKCRTIVAGSSRAPDEISGFDIAAWAAAHDLRLLSPHQDGSIRIQADVSANAEQVVQAFRGGVWKPVD